MTIPTHYRRLTEVARAVHNVRVHVEEIEAALRAVHRAVEKANWGAVICAHSEIHEARARLDEALKCLWDDVAHAVKNEQLEG